MLVFRQLQLDSGLDVWTGGVDPRPTAHLVARLKAG